MSQTYYQFNSHFCVIQFLGGGIVYIYTYTYYRELVYCIGIMEWEVLKKPFVTIIV